VYKGSINTAKVLYELGLVSIIANAAKSGKSVKPSDVNAALRIVPHTMRFIISVDCIEPILHALEPLRDRAPHMYLGLLAFASNVWNLDPDTAMYIFNELDKVLSNYSDVVEKHTWSLIHAINAYSNLLERYPNYFENYFKKETVYYIVSKVVDLLKKLSNTKSYLSAVAWAFALVPALMHEHVRRLMERTLGINVVNRANEVLEELSKLKEKIEKEGIEELRNSDKDFMDYIESNPMKADEETVRKLILHTALLLKHALAIYRFNNNELKETEGLFNEIAKGYREISDYEGYLIDRNWALRTEAIEGSLVGGKLVKEFQQLYGETFNEEHFEPTASYLSIASPILGDYLVSLVMINNVERIKELLEEHLWVLNADDKVSVLTRLMLNVMLGPRGELSSKLKDRLNVEPWELIKAFNEIDSEFLPALMTAFGVIKPEDGIKLCEGFIGDDCIDSVLAAKGNSAAVKRLRERLINAFYERISEGKVVDLLKRLSFDAKSLFDEFRGLVYGLDGKSLTQLIVPGNSMALLALILYALINGDEKLAKAYALIGGVAILNKLPIRLFLDVYKACEKGCDLGNEDLRQAITKLFLYYI
jgi:hypothetical protein